MMVFMGPVEISGVEGGVVKLKADGGVMMELLLRDDSHKVVGIVHIHKVEVDKIVAVRSAPRVITNGNKKEGRRYG